MKAKVFAVTLAAIGLSLANAVPAQALSGAQLNNTLPYQQGCGGSARVVSSRAILGGTASMVYSSTCGTNWIEWYGPVRRTTKYMWLGFYNNSNHYTTSEVDTANWSYSRQVYAPGTTPAQGEIWVMDATNTYAQGWGVRCASTCTWSQFY